MFFKGKHEAARMELRFINKTGNRHFDKTVIYIWRCLIGIPVVPHKAVAEVLSERLAAVNHGWQSAPIDGSKGG